LPEAAEKMTTQINFSNVPPISTLGNQFSPQGVTFTTANPTVGQFSSTGLTGVVAQSVRVGGGEFPTRAISGKFSTPGHSHVAATVGQFLTAFETDIFLIVYDIGGSEVERSIIKISQSQKTAFGEVVDPLARIASFSLQYTADHDFYATMIQFDNLALPQQPDFRLLYTGGNISLRPGRDQQLEIQIQRLFGSHGNISFVVNGGPDGSFVHNITPNPVNEQLKDQLVVRVDTNLNAPGGNPPANLIVTATPSSTAGSSKRTLSIPFSVIREVNAHIITVEVTQGIQ
jgi:hypothetical protein